MNNPRTRKVIVSRHQGAHQWLADLLGGKLEDHDGRLSLLTPADDQPAGQTKQWERIPILIGDVSATDVHGKIVVGNLPLHLAVHAGVVYAIEFAGPPPRGADFTADDMRAAGARLQPYSVSSFAPGSPQWKSSSPPDSSPPDSPA